MTMRLPFLAAGLLLTAASPLFAAGPARDGDDDAPVDRRLVGAWHAEASTYVGGDSDVSLIVKTTWDVTIDADGGASYHAEQITVGGSGLDDVNKKKVLADYTGTVVQRGNVLVATTRDGKEYRIKFRLSGNNGLYLDGRLFEKQ